MPFFVVVVVSELNKAPWYFLPRSLMKLEDIPGGLINSS